MISIQPYFLTFRGGLHLGTRGVNLEEAGVNLPSDTLFSAMLDIWRRNGGSPQAFAAPFCAPSPDPPFLLTSAFPYAGKVRFYPKPVDLSRLFTPDSLRERGKALKRIGYLSEGLLRRALQGERLDAWLYPADEYVEPQTGVALQGGRFWLTMDEFDQLPASMKALAAGQRHGLRRHAVYGSSRTPRVTVDRSNASSTIFHAGRITFAEECGLWFGVAELRTGALVEGTSTNYADALRYILALLQDDGIGGERTTGYGAFTVRCSEEAVDLPAPQPGNAVLLLSRYHPRPDELPSALHAGRAAYSMTAVSGWLRSPDSVAQRRKRLYLIEEGSIVCPPNAIAGDVADVRPEYAEGPTFPHPVYRFGLALAVDAGQLGETNYA